MLQMRISPFFALIKKFRERELLQDSIHTFVDDQVAMFLHVVGHNQRFKVLDQKPVHTYYDQVNLDLACCIIHNWILGWGKYEYFQVRDVPDEVEIGHGLEAGNNEA
jgi:hypothetical protein